MVFFSGVILVISAPLQGSRLPFNSLKSAFCRAKVLNFSWKQHMTVILALGILKQEDDEFEVSLSYGQ